MKPLINIKSFSDIVRLFDFMYKKAIMDCIDVDDVRKCKDFLRDMKSNKAYALLEFEYEMTWREWKNTLYFFCLRKRLNTVALILDYVNSIYSYYAVILPVAMEFYLKGVADYIECPYQDDYLRFSEKPLEIWGRPSLPKTTRRMMDDMMQLIMDRRHRVIEDPMKKAESDLKEPSPSSYDTFAECMWRLSETLKKQKQETVYDRSRKNTVVVIKPKKP